MDSVLILYGFRWIPMDSDGFCMDSILDRIWMDSGWTLMDSPWILVDVGGLPFLIGWSPFFCFDYPSGDSWE